MASKEEVKSIMLLIANEYQDFIPKNKEQQIIKLDTWHNVLSEYDYNILQQVTMQVITTHTYGTPKLSHLMSLLKPNNDDINEGLEFAQRLIELSRKYTTTSKEYVKFIDGVPYKATAKLDSCLGDKVFEEFGELGYKVYKQFKSDLRTFREEDATSIRAHIRDVYKSLKAREQQELLLGGENKIYIEKEED